MASPQDQPLEFDDFVIDVAGRRLTRAGQLLPLEPKAFDVLVLLVGAPGTAFTRDQILDAVWGHRHVTPGVLNRVMTMLRHALGEEANAPRYLHTLHGVGYRFDQPASSAAPGPPPTVDDTFVERRQALAPAPAEAGVPPSDTMGRRWMLGALGLLTLLALAWLFTDSGAPHKPATTTKVAAAPTLIVMPLKAIGEKGGAPEIAAGLSEELISELARIGGLRVIARESTSLAAADGTSMADLLPRLGITHALEGSLRQSGEALRVNIRLTDVANGRTLWSQDYDRDAADVLALQREIAQAVASALTLKLALVPAPRGGDAEFLRRYFAAHALTGMDTRTRLPTPRPPDYLEKAEAELRELAYLRPDDARPHAALALVLESRAFSHPSLGETLRQESAREAVIALGLDPGNAEAQGVQAAAACRAEDWERCVGLYERAIAATPSNSLLRFRHAMALASLGYVQRAETMIRDAKARDPLNTFWNFAHGRILDTQGLHDAARFEFAKAPDRARYGDWFNAVWRHDIDDAARISGQIGVGEAYGENADSLKPVYRTTTEALRDPGKWPEAMAAMDDWEAQTGLLAFQRVLAPDADPAALLPRLGTVRKRLYSSWDLLVWTDDLAYLRRGAAFQRYLADTGILDYWRRHGFPPQCVPSADGAQCR